MVIDLTALSYGETDWSQTAKPEDIQLVFPDYSFSAPVAVHLRITSGEEQYILKGLVQTSAHARCVKCLDEFDLPVSEEIGWVFQVVDDPHADSSPEESEDFWMISPVTARIDIGSRVRETILLSLPRDPVCRAECRGLCPNCGSNLNDGPCGCPTTKIDTHRMPLADLLGPQDNETEN